MKLETSERFRVRVKPNDSVWALKGMISSRLGAVPEHINLLYDNKDLIDDYPLSYYSIGPDDTIITSTSVPVPSPSVSPLPSSSTQCQNYIPPTSSAAGSSKVNEPSPAILTINFGRVARRPELPPRNLEYPLLTFEEATRRIEHCWSQAEIGRFDPDTEIVDPEAHYSHLEHLERNVIEESEFFRCGGNYDLGDNACINALAEDSRLPNDISDAIWQETFEGLATVPRLRAGAWEVNEDGSRSLVLGLRKSFILLRSLVAKIQKLIDSRFSIEFFSVLVDEGGDVARLIKVPFRKLSDLFGSMSNAILEIHNTANLNMDVDEIVKRNVHDPCARILEDAQITDHQLENPSMAQMLNYCRSTILFLDLALVSYVGCHASDLPHYLNSRAWEMRIPISDKQVVICSRRPLACLEPFLKIRGVWVFQPPRVQQDNYRFGRHNNGLTVLCQMKVFADVWGPVWSIMDGKGGVQQHNLSAGCIRQTAPSYHGNDAVRCHWFEDQHIAETPEAEQKYLIDIDDFLLIGAGLQENRQCEYTIDQYEIDFEGSSYMNTLKTSKVQWKWETRGVGGSLGVKAGPVNLGVTGQINQKRIPETTQKQALWTKWNADPENGHIGWLNNFSGVEVSHCTGNVRRIRTRHLLRLKPVRDRLNELSYNWEATDWGAEFIRALETEDSKQIYDFWTINPHFRKELGGLLRQLLELLVGTGTQGKHHFIAAYFKDYASRNRQMEIPIDGNEWARRFRDSQNSSVLAVVGDACLKCISEGREVGRCNQSQPSRTIYETRTRIDRGVPQVGASIRLDSEGEYFRLDRINIPRRQITLSFPTARRGVGSTGRAWNLREVVNVNSDTDYMRGDDWKVLILAASPSFGGIRKNRRRLQQVGPPSDKGRERVARRRKERKELGCCVIL